MRTSWNKIQSTTTDLLCSSRITVKMLNKSGLCTYLHCAALNLQTRDPFEDPYWPNTSVTQASSQTNTKLPQV